MNSWLFSTSLVLVVVLPSGRPNVAAEPEKGIDTTHVPKEFIAAIVVQPKRISENPIVADLSFDWGNIEKNIGFDIRTLDRAVLYIEPFPGGNSTWGPAVAVRFEKPIDEKTVLPNTLGKFEKAKLENGKEYLKRTTTQMAMVHMFAYQADVRNLLFAPEPTLRKMLAAKGPKSILNSRLSELTIDSEIIILVSPETIRDTLKQIIKENAGEIPEKWKSAATLPDRINFVTVKIDLNGPNIVHALIETTDADSAKIAARVLKDGLDFVRPMFPGIRGSLMKEAPPKVVVLLSDLLENVDKASVIETEESKVIFKIPRPKTLDESKKK